MADTQADIADRLQQKLMGRFEALLDSGEMSPTDAATLARLLSQNGWSFDPARLPSSLRNKLTQDVDFDTPALEAL